MNDDLRPLDTVPTPDQWDEIRRDAFDPSVERLPEGHEPSGPRRLAVAGFAIAVFALAGAFAYSGLREDPADDIRAVSEPAAALRVRCDGERVEVVTPVVAVGISGVQVEPTGVPPGGAVLVIWQRPHIGGYLAMDVAGSRTTKNVVKLPAGSADVVCVLEGPIEGASETRELLARAEPVEFTDPQGYYRPYVPDCAEVSAFTRSDDIDMADIENELRRLLEGEAVGDKIEPAGYHLAAEDGSREVWRVVRDDRVVAALWVGEQGGGLVDAWICPGHGLTLNGEPFEDATLP